MTENVSELLEKTLKAGDLRRKETVRLIDAAQKVAAKICDVAKEVGILVAVERPHFALRIEKDLHTLRGPLQGTALVVYELPYDLDRYSICPAHIWESEETMKRVIAADSDAVYPDGKAKPDNMPRRLWIEVIPHFATLALKLADEAERQAKETSKAATLAERLAAAVGENCSTH